MNWKASLIAAVIVIAAGAAVGVAIGGKTTTKVLTRTETVAAAPPVSSVDKSAPQVTDTTPAAGSGASPAGHSVDSLSDFESASKLEFPGDSSPSVESLNVSGTDYPEALTDTVFSDHSGFSEFKLITQARYASMSGIVGLNSGTDCPQNGALVSILDESSHLLWGPKRVGINTPAKFQVDMPNALQLRFVNRVARGTSDSGGNCSDAHADPAWAGMALVRK